MERVLPVDADEVVTTVAEEREVVFRKPLEERDAFVALIRRQRRRRAAKVRRDRARLVAHRSPIGDGCPHVVEHAVDVGRERAQRRAFHDPVDFQVDERFAQAAR